LHSVGTIGCGRTGLVQAIPVQAQYTRRLRPEINLANEDTARIQDGYHSLGRSRHQIHAERSGLLDHWMAWITTHRHLGAWNEYAFADEVGCLHGLGDIHLPL